MFAKVIVDIAHANVDRLFTYSIPDDMEIAPGHRVTVPFGSGNRVIEGCVIELTGELPGEGVRIKPIIRVMDPYPVLRADQIELAKWICVSYHCLLVDALRLMIPAQLRGDRVKEKRIRTVRIAEGTDICAVRKAMLKKDGTPKAPVQIEILDILQKTKSPMSTSDLAAFVPGASGGIRALIDKGVLCEEGFASFRDPMAGTRIIPSEPLALNRAQRAALDTINSAVDSREGNILLHGVTGSGKTEVYMQAIAGVIEKGGRAIVLVPEIALTPQTMERFRSRFGEKVALLHSALSPGERYDEWRRIRLDKVSVVVGARSAVFAPVDDLRLIVIDEEHEPSYRSEITPTYNAIEVAAKRCRQLGGVMLLGSATPSVGSYKRAKAGAYTLLELPERVKDIALPSVHIADMREEFVSGNNTIFSAELYRRLKECLEKKEQAILFINRRGYSTFVSCRGCGYVIKCPDCDVSMTYHKLEDRLKCHYCNRTMRVPKVCPDCGKPYLKQFGIGTQQVEEQFLMKFPGAKALRMDMDTTRGKNSHREILDKFTRGEADVLIGTQMVAKGLDIPNVTLVGVIAADATLHIPDYRSCERTFQLLTQVSGRAGRDKKPGSVVIQTYSPTHPAVALSAKHDYKTFYEYEIAARRAALFPPFSLFIRVLFAGADEDTVAKEADTFREGLDSAMREALTASGGDERELLMVISTPSPIRRRQARYRYQVLVKLARTKNSSAVIRAVYAFFDSHRTEHIAGMEINPQNMF